MDVSEKPYITFGAQMGDLKSASAVGPRLIELRRLLKKDFARPYSPEIDKLAPVLRVDGDIWHWDVEGIEKLRLARKKRYITIDIMMPRSRWQDASAIEIRCYLIENPKAAFRLIVDRLKKEHIEVDEKRLFEDFAKVEREYLATTTEHGHTL